VRQFQNADSGTVLSINFKQKKVKRRLRRPAASVSGATAPISIELSGMYPKTI
jgi:hypothetical protein